MVLEGLPTQMTMMAMAVAIQRLFLATSQGRGTSGDPANRQTDRQTNIDTTLLFTFFPLLACISTIYILFETLGCI